MNCSNGHANPQGAQFCNACGALLPPTLPAAPAEPTHRGIPLSWKKGWWDIRFWGLWHGIGIVVVALIVLSVIGSLVSSDTDEPETYTELCEFLRSPENDVFDRGDIEGLFDMTDWQLQRYVNARCPDQYDRVD